MAVPLLIVGVLSFISGCLAYVNGINNIQTFLILICFIILLILFILLIVVKRYFLAGLLMILLFVLSSIYVVYSWGMSLPYSIIYPLLTIHFVFLIMNAKDATVFSGIFLLILFSIVILQIRGNLIYDFSWEPVISIFDLFLLSVLFVLFIITLWISSNGSKNQTLKIRSLINELDTLNKDLKHEIVLKTREIISNKTKLTESHKVLQSAYNQLEDSEQDRFTRMNLLAHYGTLLTSVAHEMANPLMSVMAYIDEIPNRDKDQAKKSVDELADMVRTLRGSVRIGLPNDLIKVSSAVIDAKRMLDWKIKKKQVLCILEIKEQIYTKGDGSKFIQIVLNIIDNAMDFGADKIEVIVFKKNDLGYIRVKDNGKGIIKNSQKKIFEIFYSTKKTGNGVGLYISKQYAIDLFKGNLSLTNENEGYTIFDFSFKIIDT